MSFVNRDGPQGTADAMKASNPFPTAPEPDRARTAAHLASNVHGQLQHVDRHISEAQNAESPESLAFNLQHAASHVADGLSHSSHLLQAMGERDPEIKAELDQMGPGADDHEAVVQP